MATEIKWADGNAIVADSEIRWSDSSPYYYYVYEEPAGTEYRMIFHNHYQQMKVV